MFIAHFLTFISIILYFITYYQLCYVTNQYFEIKNYNITSTNINMTICESYNIIPINITLNKIQHISPMVKQNDCLLDSNHSLFCDLNKQYDSSITYNCVDYNQYKILCIHTNTYNINVTYHINKSFIINNIVYNGVQIVNTYKEANDLLNYNNNHIYICNNKIYYNQINNITYITNNIINNRSNSYKIHVISFYLIANIILELLSIYSLVATIDYFYMVFNYNNGAKEILVTMFGTYIILVVILLIHYIIVLSNNLYDSAFININETFIYLT